MQWVGTEGSTERGRGSCHYGRLHLSVVRSARHNVSEDIKYRTRVILDTKSTFKSKYSQKHVHTIQFWKYWLCIHY